MTGVDKLEDEVSKLATNINQAYERLLSLERYSRDLNLRFYNIPQDSNENCTEQLKKRPYYLMIWTCIKPVIENGHRIGGPRTSASNDPRPVIAKFIYRLERLKQRVTGYPHQEFLRHEIAVRPADFKLTFDVSVPAMPVWPRDTCCCLIS
ncbi:unnamed protein product, partial [Porites lobata]